MIYLDLSINHDYLERHIDSKRKFKFDTYEVDDTDETQEAIAKNGLVEVEFYRECQLSRFDRSIIYEPFANITYTTGDASYTTDTSDANSSVFCSSSPSKRTMDKVETGRVEEGSNSNQSFRQVNKRFSALALWIVTYHLLPESQKPITTKVRTYCTECGRVIKKGWKFCAGCGTKA